MRRVFVTGTDTGVGKTVVCAWIARHWGASYWKPVQSGLAERDADTVERLGGLSRERLHPSTYELRAPLSPHEAARREGRCIDIEAFALPSLSGPLVVEGAGGVLVPLNDEHRIIDLMVRLGLPALIVARSGLGTLNHTLLTLEALRRRSIRIAGVVLNGPPNQPNREAIERLGQVPRVVELALITPLDAEAIARLPPPPDFSEPST